MVKFRKGDRVQLDGIVAADFDDVKSGEAGVHIDLIGDNTCKPIVDPKHVRLARPVFAVGDRISCGHLTGTVVSVAGDGDDALLWVRDEADRRMHTLDAIACNRLDGAPTAAGGWEPYTVQPGDTLRALALRYGATVEALALRNGIESSDHLEAGATILLPALTF